MERKRFHGRDIASQFCTGASCSRRASGPPPDVRIFTGFGYKERHVINVRTSDIVIIFGASMRPLDEFTIAYDEGKIIGVLEGTGGVAD